METYFQHLSIRFRSAASARRARLRIAPLYHDLRAAFSTRMDDNNTNALRVLRVMKRHRQRGTFFLNDPGAWWEDGPGPRAYRAADPRILVPARILASGSSIGGHTMNHEHLPVLSKNAAFREIVSARAVLEAETGSAVSTFTFPFVCFQSDLRGGRDRADLEEMLRRSGFLLLGEHRYNLRRSTGLLDAVFINCDGGPWEGASDDEVVARLERPGLRPLFLVTMHAWLRSWGGLRFPLLGDAYRKWAGRKEWWYCNQNEYAAYRWQALRSSVDATVQGNLMTATLSRPDPRDLMDSVPLTVVVEGVSAADVVSATGGAPYVARLSIGRRCALDILHSQDRGPVERFGKSENELNARRLAPGSPSTAGLKALLFRTGRTLTLFLRNTGTKPISDLRVVFRLPLRWKPGVIRRTLQRLGAGRTAAIHVALEGRARPAEYSVGNEYNVAQIDFVGKARARLYATCSVPGPAPGPGFARDGFRFLGPLPDETRDWGLMQFAGPRTPPPFRGLAWATIGPVRASILDPDIIPITGRPRAADFPDSHPMPQDPGALFRYLIWGYARSQSKQSVTAVFSRDCVKGLALNGQMVRGTTLALKRGANEIRILYSPPKAADALFSEHHYGCYFRLADAAGDRVKGVRFSRSP